MLRGLRRYLRTAPFTELPHRRALLGELPLTRRERELFHTVG